MTETFLEGRVLVKVGDITEEEVDAIVNAANPSLMGGGGVDGAIHRKGGPDILAECSEIRRTIYPGGLPTGAAVITTAGKLPARNVIHTVGPIYGRSTECPELLAACYQNSLRLAAENDLKTIAFPSISTGVYGYPKTEAAKIASSAVGSYLALASPVIEVRLVFYSLEDAETFLQHHVL